MSRHTLVSALVVLACAGGLVALKLHWFGEVLPNTFHVKGGHFPWPNGQQYLLSFLQVPWTPLSFALLGALLWGLSQPMTRLPALVGLAYLGVAVGTNGDFFANFRYLVPALPAFAACVAGAAQALLSAFERPANGRIWLALGAAVMVGPVLGVRSVEDLRNNNDFPRTSAVMSAKDAPFLQPWLSARASVGFQETWVFPTAWVLTHTNPYEVVAFTDIGLFSWVNGNRVVDLLGLTDRVMAGRTEDGPSVQWREQQTYLEENVNFLLLDRSSGRWRRFESSFEERGWTDVDGCQTVRVLVSPRVTRDPTRVWSNKLEARVLQAIDRTPGHGPLHLAVVRELIAGQADASVVNAAIDAASVHASQQVGRVLDGLRCGGAGQPACGELRDQCGGMRGVERGDHWVAGEVAASAPSAGAVETPELADPAGALMPANQAVGPAPERGRKAPRPPKSRKP